MAKGPNAFRTISEAADEVGVPQHVLRFWEGKFSFISPMKRAGGRRFYRPQDVEILRGVRRLLHEDGLTIKGVQKLYKDHGARRILAAARGEASAESPAPASAPESELNEESRERLSATMQDLEAIKARLDALLRRD